MTRLRLATAARRYVQSYLRSIARAAAPLGRLRMAFWFVVISAALHATTIFWDKLSQGPAAAVAAMAPREDHDPRERPIQIRLRKPEVQKTLAEVAALMKAAEQLKKELEKPEPPPEPKKEEEKKKPEEKKPEEKPAPPPRAGKEDPKAPEPEKEKKVVLSEKAKPEEPKKEEPKKVEGAKTGTAKNAGVKEAPPDPKLALEGLAKSTQAKPTKPVDDPSKVGEPKKEVALKPVPSKAEGPPPPPPPPPLKKEEPRKEPPKEPPKPPPTAPEKSADLKATDLEKFDTPFKQLPPKPKPPAPRPVPSRAEGPELAKALPPPPPPGGGGVPAPAPPAPAPAPKPAPTPALAQAPIKRNPTVGLGPRQTPPPAPVPAPPAAKPVPSKVEEPAPQAPAPAPAQPKGPVGDPRRPIGPGTGIAKAKVYRESSAIGQGTAAEQEARVTHNAKIAFGDDWNDFECDGGEQRKGERVPGILITNSSEDDWTQLCRHFELLPIAFDGRDKSCFILIDLARHSLQKTTDFDFLKTRYAASGMKILSKRLWSTPAFAGAASLVARTYDIPASQIEVMVLAPRPVMAYMAWKSSKVIQEHRLRPDDVRACLARFDRATDGGWVLTITQILKEDGAAVKVVAQAK